MLVILTNIDNSNLSYIENVASKLVMPVQNGLTYLKNKINGNNAFFTDINNLKNENEELKKQNSENLIEKISKKIGTYTTTSWSESSDKKSDNGGSNSMNLISRALLTPDEILRLQRPYLLVMCSGSEPAITNAPDLSKWNFNKLLGLGDKNWNIKVRQKRENARQIKRIAPLELWDIDKQTMELKQKKKEQELEERRLNFMKRQGAIEYPKGNL